MGATPQQPLLQVKGAPPATLWERSSQIAWDLIFSSGVSPVPQETAPKSMLPHAGVSAQKVGLLNVAVGGGGMQCPPIASQSETQWLQAASIASRQQPSMQSIAPGGPKTAQSAAPEHRMACWQAGVFWRFSQRSSMQVRPSQQPFVPPQNSFSSAQDSPVSQASPTPLPSLSD